MLPHFFKQFLFWLCFCWRRRHQWHHRPPRCCDCVAAFFQTCFSVFLLEAEGTTPRAFKVLCCRISSNNSFFGCVSAGGGVTSGISDRQGAVTVLLHFFKHVFFCLSAGGIKRCSSSMCIQGAVLVLLHWCSSTVLQTIYFVSLLEAPSMPSRPKVLCCCISSNMFFFGVSAGGVKRSSTAEKIEGAVLLHFFNEFFFCVSAGGIIKRCCRRQLRLRS